ncbi:hypothetical protein B0J18DRAFT_69334 [Chaetomium sp. MPI-SDFR-AT-0129]|nr:hypothetical protein B0J18DRAFT_69334 [Chaetomium sp. MPI-SDFR-AT-0129]
MLKMAILPRRPEHQSVLDIPTPPLQQAALFVIFFFTALAFVTYVLRAITRIRTRTWGIDDYLITGAMIFSLMMIGPFYMYIKLEYFGWHTWDVPKFDPAPGMWWFYLAQLFYNPILALVKASVLCFLLRLGGQKPGVRNAIYFLNTFNALQAIAIFLVATLQCLPIEANWDAAVKADPNTKCIDNSFHVTISSITILTDIAVIALPFWIFLGLKMPRAAKVAVLGIFTMGLAVTIIGIVRLHGVIALFYLKSNATDPLYNITVTLSVVESNLAIASACAPALRPLFRSVLPGLFGGSSANNKYNPNNNYPHPSSRSTPYALSGNRGTKNGTGLDDNNTHGRTESASAATRHSSIRLKNLRGGGHPVMGLTECRSVSPSGSEEEIMTYNGIMRTTDVQVHYDDRRLDRHHHGGGGNGNRSGVRTDESPSSRGSSDLKGVAR